MKQRALPKVSVLIPAYNEEKYIDRTLTALLQQDYPNFEIIIANNASTDDTASCVERFINSHKASHVPITLVFEGQQGTNFARECARQRATGSVIAQMDADCIPSATWISRGVQYLLSGKRVAVTGPYDYFDGTGWMRFATLLTQCLTYPLINTIVQLAQRGAILIGGNTFIRAEALEKAGGYNTDLTFYGDDVDMGARLSQIGYVMYAPLLVLASSSRRYNAIGFWQVNKKYQSSFWNLVFHKNQLTLDTIEGNHPR
ncbi:MAG: hypothetical protein NVSMB63_10430 [Sediminibacterium sp.]